MAQNNSRLFIILQGFRRNQKCLCAGKGGMTPTAYGGWLCPPSPTWGMQDNCWGIGQECWLSSDNRKSTCPAPQEHHLWCWISISLWKSSPLHTIALDWVWIIFLFMPNLWGMRWGESRVNHQTSSYLQATFCFSGNEVIFMCRGNPEMWAPAKTFIYTKLRGGDICLCPKLGQLPYIRRKVANLSVLIPSRQKLITSKTNIPRHPAVPGSTQGSLYSARLVAAIMLWIVVQLRWKSI